MNIGKQLEPEEIAFTQSIHAVFLREKELRFEEAVREYRRIETEFVERSRNDEFKLKETQRRITEWLLSFAFRADQSHQVCRDIWDELVQRGFSNAEKRHTMSGIYARCCQDHGEFEAGIAVLDPLITELEQLLQDPTLTPEMRAFGEYYIVIHFEIRDELKAGIQY